MMNRQHAFMASRTTRSPAYADSNACSSSIGRAFSVDDGLLALRWAEIMRSRGYRLTFSHSFADADEAIKIHQQSEKRAFATILLGVHWVWIVDRIGRATPHDSVAAALISLVCLSKKERQALLAPQIPQWLWQFQPTKLATQRGLWKTLGVCSRSRVWWRQLLGRS